MYEVKVISHGKFVFYIGMHVNYTTKSRKDWTIIVKKDFLLN